jgi:hypothetical protein
MPMNVKIESVLWEFAKLYRKKLVAEHPDQPIGMNIAAVATLQAMRANGDAVEELDADGNSIWRATPRFLHATGLEAGPLVIFGPEVH